MRITAVLLAVVVAVPVAACTSDEAEAPGSSIPGTGSEVEGGTQVDGGSGAPPVSTSSQMTPAPNPNAGGGSGGGTMP